MVRLPSVWVKSLMVALSSILARSAVAWISGGGCCFLLDLCVPLLGVSGVAFFLGLGGIVGRTTNSKVIPDEKKFIAVFSPAAVKQVAGYTAILMSG